MPAKKETLVEVDGRQLALTNLDKVLYPATGTTKGDTIAYLRAVAGVMLPHYSALKVAEQFRVLEAIAPGRIDLGVGRAPGSDRLTAYALNPYANGAEDFPRQVHELRAWIANEPLDEDHPFRTIKAHPTGPTTPELWILGSSDYGAQLAALRPLYDSGALRLVLDRTSRAAVPCASAHAAQHGPRTATMRAVAHMQEALTVRL